MPQFTSIPKGTNASVCKAAACKKVIWWIKTGNDKNMPVDCEDAGAKRPTEKDLGYGTPHWANCPDAPTFKKARTARDA